MTIQFSFTLDRPQMTLLGYALQVPVKRYPLSLPRIDPDPARLNHAVTVATDLLRRQRLHTGQTLNPRVHVAFALFKTCLVEAALTGIDEDGDQFRALGLSDGRQALIVTQIDHDDQVQFRLLDDDEWIDELAAVAPQMPAAPGRELVIEHEIADRSPRSAFMTRRAEAATADEHETRSYEQAPIMSMVRPPTSPFHGSIRTDHDAATATLTRERAGSGRTIVTGHRRRRVQPGTAAPIAWFDTQLGRYLLHSSTDGSIVTTRLRPGGTSALAAALTDAVSLVY